MSLKPFDQIFTTTDVDILTRDIDAHLDSLYRLDTTENIDKDNLRKTKIEVKTWPVMGLTLAFEPTVEQIKKWVSWARAEVHPKTILDIRLDTNLLAGAQIVYGGKYIDLSVAKKLETYAF